MKNIAQMKKIRRRSPSAAFVAFVAFVASPLWAAFENVGSGARPGAMGDAFTAVAGDVHAIYFNPGSLGALGRPELTSMYSRLFMGLSDNSDIGVSQLAYGQPLGSAGQWGNLGFGMWRLKLENLFTEQSLHAAYSRNWLELGGGKLYAGFSAKWLTRSFGITPETQNAINLSGTSSGQSDPVFARGYSKSAPSLDVGALYRFWNIYSIGLALQNVNQPNLALSSTDKDVVPLTTRLGVSAQLYRTRFAVDGVQRASIPGALDTNVHIGIERWWLLRETDAVTLRAGLSTGNRSFRRLSLGAGYQFSRIAFNYGFLLPMGTITQTDGSHQLSFSLRFGRESADDSVESELLRIERLARVKAERDLAESKKAHQLAVEKLDLVMAELEGLRKSGASATAYEEMLRRKLQAEEEEKRAKTKTDESLRELEKTYELSWSYYQRRARTDATMQERIDLLEKIIAKYSNKGINIRPVTEELARLKREQTKLAHEFGTSWAHYQQMVQQGASRETRVEVLHRIIKLYEKQGVDLTPIRQELINLGEK